MKNTLEAVFPPAPITWYLPKILFSCPGLIMNYIGLLLIAASMQVSAAAFSQQVTLRLENATIDRLFGDIRKQTGYNFLYRDEIMEDVGMISVNVTSLPLTAVLDQVLSPKDLRYTILDETILVWKSDSRGASEENSSSSFDSRPSAAIRRPASVDLPAEILSGSRIRQWLVRGVVTDDGGQALPGVSVQVAGTVLGVVTDESGAFSIQLPGESATLTFSLIGYRSEERSVSGSERLTVVMQQDAEALEEAVVIGYGVQRKVNLTGSVAQISPASIEKRTVPQLSQLFGGQISGVTAPQPSGEPGDAGSITIRGRGTFSSAGNAPLIIVDGIPRSMNSIDPATIESISVLKDAASASIYGARAANGVILITTKRGKIGFVEVSYAGYGGIQKPTAFPDLVDSWEWMELYNEALTNYGQQPLYTDQEIGKARSGTDPEFANVNHLKELFESGNGFQTSHNVNVSGGNDLTLYFISMGYQRQNGLVRRNKYDRYNLSLNLDQKLSDKIDIALTLHGIVSKTEEPAITVVPGIGGIRSRTGSVRELAYIASIFYPFLPGRYPNGEYSHYVRVRPSVPAILDSESFRSEAGHQVNSSATVNYRVLEGLKLSGRIGYDFGQGAVKQFNSTMSFSDGLWFGPAIMSDNIGLSSYFTSQLLMQYEAQWQGHQFLALAGASAEESKGKGYGLERQDFPNDYLRAISAGSSSSATNSGSINEWSMQSLFGRLQYSFRDRYLAEVNVRYDGSSRFPKHKRFGLFPSVSFGWRLSEETFFDVPWVSQLKPRFSWGELGNNNVGNYPYQFSISLGQDAVIGSQEVSGASVTALPSRNIGWETTRITNMGADLGLFNHKLGITIDRFWKTTDGVLYRVNTSPFLGLSSSIENAGKVVNRGWDLQLDYDGRIIKELTIRFSPNVSIVKNEVLSLANTERSISQVGGDYYTLLEPGIPMFSFYGFRSDGIFKDVADIESYPLQPYNVTPGDIRYKDISGPDGVPDGKVDLEYDRTVLGSDFPKYTYGGEIELVFKQFDLNVLFQGASGVKGVLRRSLALPFYGGALVRRDQQEGRWTMDNPDPHARIPKLGLAGNSIKNLASSDFWIIDASYLRVKNIQIGYSFPKTALDRLGINQLRVYLNAMNPVSFDSFYKGYDPDFTTGVVQEYYPLTTTFSAGVNIQF